jgi:tetratricopeptide (TPR) repeat protein
LDRYTRSDVLRILRITAQQLAGWEKAGLISASESYSFSELLQITKIRDLRASKVRPAMIRASLQAMLQQAAGMANPLLETGAYSVSHRRIVFRHAGKAVEPIRGQFMLDFEPEAKVLEARSAKVSQIPATDNVQDLFARGVALEDDAASQSDAIECYKRVLQAEPGHAAAHINLGTIFYNRNDYNLAEKHYRASVEADPRYALGYFDLGNVLDETGRLEEAVNAYQTAIKLAPTYADAHYNLALAYEKLKQPRLALRHWKAYVRLDGVGAWATHAKSQIQRILSTEKLQIIHRR